MNQTQDLPVSSSGRDLQKSNRVMLGVVTEAKATRPGFVEVFFLFSFHSPLAPLLSLILIIKGVEILEKNRLSYWGKAKTKQVKYIVWSIYLAACTKRVFP